MDLTALGGMHYSRQVQERAMGSGLQKGAAGGDQKLMEACREFESLFVKQMLNSMKKTVPESDLMSGGMGEDIFEDMLYDKYAQSISRTADLGIARMLYSELSS